MANHLIFKNKMDVTPALVICGMAFAMIIVSAQIASIAFAQNADGNEKPAAAAPAAAAPADNAAQEPAAKEAKKTDAPKAEGDKPAAAASNDPAQVFRRVVLSRVYHQQKWMAGKETPGTVGEALGALHPTLVSGLVCLSSKQAISDEEANAYIEIRKRVQAISPKCKFDFALDASQYKTADEITGQMKQITAKAHPDAWYFESFGDAFKQSPDVIQAAIACAHSQNQLIGGYVGDKEIPPDSDFVTLSGNKGVVKMREQLTKLKEQRPISFLATFISEPAPSNKDDVENWVAKIAKNQELDFVESLASNQSTDKFRLMYPIMLCDAQGSNAYNAFTEGKMISLEKGLMDRFNPLDKVLDVPIPPEPKPQPARTADSGGGDKKAGAGGGGGNADQGGGGKNQDKNQGRATNNQPRMTQPRNNNNNRGIRAPTQPRQPNRNNNRKG
ncbi:MAG: hypothetical protein NTX50_16550 [Candidatus Sumerlaeota bacterium]|nr:hypothetical protein [Candidatus Sumerlaeota bacterium]